MSIEPDTEDWTWVLDRPCPACGYAAAEITVDRLAPGIRDSATAWEALLLQQQPAELLATRLDPATWSTLEYACHVRDVHRVFGRRVELMLTRDDPTFENWDQDAAAAAGDYARSDLDAVARDLMDAADAVATAYDSVAPGAWGRRGLRDNGSEFSVESLGRYHLHDVVHHLHDVRVAASRDPAGR